jgi:hypothetical protein
MNCLEFRRETLADPGRPSEAARAHASQCAACSQFRAETLKLDEAIVAGISVPVPEGFGQRMARNARGPDVERRRRFMALAASLALGVGIGAGAYVWERDDPLARASIDFVVDEEVNAILTSKPSDFSALQSVARALNVQIPQVGEVRYIGTCPFQGTIAHHVVVMTEGGKATLLLLPDKAVGEKARASARGLRAVVAPARGGSVAIISGASDLARLEQIVNRS